MKVNWFKKWISLTRQERRFLSIVDLMREKYDYCCMIKNREITLKEFLDFYK